MRNADMPAYPALMKVGDVAKSEGGLTKREYFAAMAMQGFCAAPDLKDPDIESVAESSVNQADALLAELEKES